MIDPAQLNISALDQFAYELFRDETRTLGIMIFCTGFVLGIVSQATTRCEMRRASFLITSAVLYMVSSYVPKAMLAIEMAFAHDVYWSIAAFVIAGKLACAFAFGAASAARSRNAFNSLLPLIALLVPFFMVVLMVKGPHPEASADTRSRARRLLVAALAIPVALASFILGATTRDRLNEENAEMQQALAFHPVVGTRLTFMEARYLVKSLPIEEVVREIAAATTVPFVMDEETKMTAIQSKGPVLYRTLSVGVQLDEVPVSPELHEMISMGTCFDPAFDTYIRHGMVVVDTYINWSGEVLLRHATARVDCDKIAGKIPPWESEG